jgi:aspartate ammonia-lyase
MRQEQDSLGEWLLSDEDYFGIDTARIDSAIVVSGPCVPREIAVNIIRIRQAQAIAFGRIGAWSPRAAAAIEAAAAKMVAAEVDWTPHIRMNMLHGGGARSFVGNVDEVLANYGLEEIGSPRGEYHLLAELFQSNKGIEPIKTFMIAVNITLIEKMDTAIAVINKVIEKLITQAEKRKNQETIARIHFQEIKLTDMGSEFRPCAESLRRLLEQVERFRNQLLPGWYGSTEVLTVLREITGLELLKTEGEYEFPLSFDLYIGLSALIKTIATTLLQLCNNLRFYIGMSKELESSRFRSGPAFNPTSGEMVVLDTVSQITFQIIGKEAAIAAAISSGANGLAAYLPLVSSNLVYALGMLGDSLHLVAERLLSDLTGDQEVGKKAVADSLLQAEKLIPLIGYERAVQVARIAALTDKPVKTVVVKMKMMTEQQATDFLGG